MGWILVFMVVITGIALITMLTSHDEMDDMIADPERAFEDVDF